MYLGGWGIYNLWGPIHHGGRAGSFVFADMHVDTVSIEEWATNVGMWGSIPCAGCTRTVAGWTYALYE